MKRVLIAVLVLMFSWSPGQAQTDKVLLTEAIQDWSKVRCALVFDEGDYATHTHFQLERQTDGQVKLTTSENDRHPIGQQPEVFKMVDNETARKLISQVAHFYLQALRETSERERVDALPAAEQKAILAKYRFGITAKYISIKVTSPKGDHEYGNDFADQSPAIDECEKFIREQYVSSP